MRLVAAEILAEPGLGRARAAVPEPPDAAGARRVAADALPDRDAMRPRKHATRQRRIRQRLRHQRAEPDREHEGERGPPEPPPPPTPKNPSRHGAEPNAAK